MENCCANFINYRQYLKETSHSTENIPLLPKFSNRFMKEFDLNFIVRNVVMSVIPTPLQTILPASQEAHCPVLGTMLRKCVGEDASIGECGAPP